MRLVFDLIQKSVRHISNLLWHSFHLPKIPPRVNFEERVTQILIHALVSFKSSDRSKKPYDVTRLFHKFELINFFATF